MSQQLVKKDTNGKYSNVNPKSWIEAIKDKSTGKPLVEILQGINMYYLPYTGDIESTRLQVPMLLRKRGLWLVFEDYDDIIHIEWYDNKSIKDEDWIDSSNWLNVDFSEGGGGGESALIKLKLENNTLFISYNNGVSWSTVGTVQNLYANEEDLIIEANTLKFNNRDTSKGKGYIILRTNKSLLEQITQENTIYEVRYNFDLGGTLLEMPNNCVLYFKGGSINNGKITGSGLRTINKNRGTSVFTNGVNLNDEQDWLKASEIGMIPDNESLAYVNDNILDNVISEGKYLELDGHYYFSNTHNISGVLKIKNGELTYTKDIFIVPEEGASLTFENVKIKGVDHFIQKLSLNYVIKEIIFNGCTIEHIRVCKIVGANVLYENTPYGLERFSVTNCKFYDMENSSFIMQDLVISKECVFNYNYVDMFKYSLLNFGKNNNYSNITDNEIYGADVVFKGNVIKGAVCNNDSYYTPLLLDGVKNAYYEGNVVSNMIGIGNGNITYDCYGSASNYTCKDNVFTNICQLPKGGVMAATISEIFKCKGGGGIKKAINNIWSIDFAECREILAENGITFTDEAFGAINQLGLLKLTSVTDEIQFLNNTITIRGGKLAGNTSSIDIKKITIDGNTFNLDSYVNNSGLFPNWNGNSEFITITNNKVTINDDSDFTFCGKPGQREYRSNAVVVVSNNIVNRPVAIPALNARMTVINNIQKMLNNSQTAFNIRGAEEPSVIESYINFNGSREFKLTSSVREFKNVDYNYTIHNTSNSHYLGVLVLSGVSADLIFECGDKIEFRAKNTDDEISVTDKYGNTLATSANTSYTALFENSQIKISVKYSTAQGFFFYITYKVDDLTYNLNIASIEMNKIGVQTLNKYTKGAFKFDTTANKPVWWNGTKWVDATGADV